ncbi:MAG: tetratricopeptide repeat protein [Ilumatobacteraceae bacterium]
MEPDEDWERRLSEWWASFDEHDEDEAVAGIEALAAELPADHAVAAYERASALDSVGRPGPAVALYRQALAAGLGPDRRRQAVIQLASSLRNLGEAGESVALLAAERIADADELDDAVAAFLALALADSGREREAVAVALTALSRHMTRYRRSLSAYAAELVPGPDLGVDAP